MKAWVLERQAKMEEKPLKLKEVPTPEPEDKEIRIKIHYSGICRTDTHIIKGELPLKKSNLIPGHQITGIVDKIGRDVKKFKIGDRAGIAWLNSTCGNCRFCLRGEENYCEKIKLTGWSVDGGYAEYAVISEDFAYPLGENLPLKDFAPLMCAGIAGYRALKLTRVREGDKLGLYGFGPTAFYIFQVAESLGIECFVATIGEESKNWAKEAGAAWIEENIEKLPAKMDGAVIFPPVSDLIKPALSKLNKGGNLILAPVTMDKPISLGDYDNFWGKGIRSLIHFTRKDGKEFLKKAEEIKIKTKTQIFNFNQIPEALILYDSGKVKGTPVIKVV